MELVRDIEVFYEIKDKIQYLYYNIYLKKWFHLFKRPFIIGKSKAGESI
jgi:hypothetical protein